MYTNLFVSWTHKLGCEIIYFLYILTYLVRVYILIKIIFYDVDAFIFHVKLFICV
jgi:hypothetical protein